MKSLFALIVLGVTAASFAAMGTSPATSPAPTVACCCTDCACDDCGCDDCCTGGACCENCADCCDAGCCGGSSCCSAGACCETPC